MSDDWDCDNYIIPILNVQNKEQLKQLEERKLVEESDNALMNELFDNTNAKSNRSNKETSEIIQNINNKETNETNETKKNKKENPVSKQQENELKQKNLSEKRKNKKEAEKKHSDTFGEFIYDEYDYYVDKFGKFD
jgi:hypothetical protein